MSKMSELSIAEQNNKRELADIALHIPPMIRVQVTVFVAKSIAMCIQRHGLPYESVKGSEIGTIDVVDINGCKCGLVTYPGKRRGYGMAFLIEPSGQVMWKKCDPGIQELPRFIDPEKAFQEDQDKAFHELTNYQFPKDE